METPKIAVFPETLGSHPPKGLADGEVECWKFVKRLVLVGRFKYSLVIQNSSLDDCPFT
jgi:hypothetical protein